MLPDQIALILQQLSYIVIVICGPLIVYYVIKTIILEVKFDNHVERNAQSHAEMIDHIGKHYSRIHDLEMDLAEISGRNSHL